MHKPQYFFHKNCNICKATSSHEVTRLGKQRLVQCNQCKLVYLDLQRSDLATIYSDKYFSKDKNNKSNYFCYANLANKNIWRSNFKFAYDLIEESSVRANLLDIGSGFGDFIQYLPKNIHSEAVEISQLGAKMTREKNIKVYQQDFFTVKLSKKYDFVTSFDVIEHQIQLSVFLKKVNSSLKKNGFFIFSTPDYDSLFNKIFGNKAPLIQPNHHNYYLNQAWIKKNLPLFGFKIVKIKTTYLTLTPIEQALMLASFPFPIINRLGLISLISKTGLGKVTLPFLRFGGIQVIAQRIN